MTAEWSELHEAFAAGRTTEHAPNAIRDRRVEFEDGTLWFPDGACDPQAARLGPAALFGLTIIFGMGSLVLFMDSHPWALASLAPLGLCVLGLAMVIRRIHARERAAEARLERGLFLLADALVLRDPPWDERVPRASITGFAIRLHKRGGETSLPWIHVVRSGGKAEVPLGVTDVSLPVLEDWLKPTVQAPNARSEQPG